MIKCSLLWLQLTNTPIV